MLDRVAILDGPKTVEGVEGLTRAAVPTAGGDARRRTPPPAGGGGAAPAPAADDRSAAAAFRPRESKAGFGAFYFPWIVVQNPFSPKDQVEVAPSGHLAGIYARTDATRGVHKAPANEPIRGALNVTYPVTNGEQEVLNPAGVNAIRFFSREGVLVWGARTVAPSASEWRYLNVRRLFSMIEKSIARATRWVVFEGNDEPLWKAIRRDISAFLTLLWRDGALMGATASEAFFVQCDRETNPPEVIDAGMVITVIGIAPVKPAEFIIFRIGQSAGGAKVEV
jgi:phage tail sheath protein FI